jgi:hypothetical protein
MAKHFIRRSLLGLSAIALTMGMQAAPIGAQTEGTGGGLTLWGGVDADFRLPYQLQYNTRRSPRTRMVLRVPGDKVERAVSQLIITYPEAFTNYSGSFNVDSIEVRRGRGTNGALIPVDEVVWTPENQSLNIYLLDDIPADTTFTIVASDVRNPNRALMSRFNLQMQYRGDVLPVYGGTWELLLAYEDN